MSGVMDDCREEKGVVVESLRVGEREGRDEEEEGKWGGVCSRGGGTEGKSVPCTRQGCSQIRKSSSTHTTHPGYNQSLYSKIVRSLQ